MYTNKPPLSDEHNIIDKEAAVFRKYRFLLNPSNYYLPFESGSVELADRINNSNSHDSNTCRNDEEMALEYAQLVRNAEYIPSWSKSVMAVIMSSDDLTQIGQCSICLNDPAVLPRINRCGHIFCLSCLWEYTVSAETVQPDFTPSITSNTDTPTSLAWDITAKRYICPLCLITLEISNLRPVVITDKLQDNCGSRLYATKCDDRPIILDLKARWAKSTVVITANPDHNPWSDSNKLIDLPWDCSQDGTSMNHAQYLLMTESFARRQLALELEEVIAFNNAQRETLAVTNAISNDIVKYINREYERMLNFLSGFDAYQVLDGRYSRRSTELKVKDDSNPTSGVKRRLRKKKQTAELVYLSGSSEPSSSSLCSPSASSSSISLVTPAVNERLFFYQPRNMPRTFLSYLDFKIVLAWFGNFDQFPARIENVRIIGKLRQNKYSTETVVVDADLKHRIRYLNYLPIGAIINFIEMDWLAMDQVPPEVLQPFKAQLQQRKQKRNSSSIADTRLNIEKQTEYGTVDLQEVQIALPAVDQHSPNADLIDHSDTVNDGYSNKNDTSYYDEYGDEYSEEYGNDQYFDDEEEFEDPTDFDYVRHYGNHQRFDSRPYMEYERQNEGPSSWLEGLDLTTPLKALDQDEKGPSNASFKTKGKKQKKFLVISSGNQRKL
ncbi:hypothetical protein NADFUDRAFT_51414 [Nadsonia fulvescens var. elongata DSM 6958]|uniref:RING-type domain-containing protein n=1 Tax=Nadsonia fulvescens var. elongata DSM 6958 TaxID=857566 RepID=A0A1E3PMU2_9ASCO|nr:hypothetical protein NADFUDRAFT_51414 [Nadsonia fulvescens var. elongata DSM 6958]